MYSIYNKYMLFFIDFGLVISTVFWIIKDGFIILLSKNQLNDIMHLKKKIMEMEMLSYV